MQFETEGIEADLSSDILHDNLIKPRILNFLFLTHAWLLFFLFSFTQVAEEKISNMRTVRFFGQERNEMKRCVVMSDVVVCWYEIAVVVGWHEIAVVVGWHEIAVVVGWHEIAVSSIVALVVVYFIDSNTGMRGAFCFTTILRCYVSQSSLIMYLALNSFSFYCRRYNNELRKILHLMYRESTANSVFFGAVSVVLSL